MRLTTVSRPDPISIFASPPLRAIPYPPCEPRPSSPSSHPPRSFLSSSPDSYPRFSLFNQYPGGLPEFPRTPALTPVCTASCACTGMGLPGKPARLSLGIVINYDIVLPRRIKDKQINASRPAFGTNPRAKFIGLLGRGSSSTTLDQLRAELARTLVFRFR